MPAVAGRFYPASAEELEREVRGFLAVEPDRQEGEASALAAVAVMAPHAGYVYSGGVAGKVFAGIEVPERVIIACPNHTGLGPRVSIIERGAYRIPGADVPIDHELAAAIKAEYGAASWDRQAHRFEHAIEVEVPFLLARQPALRIVPMVLSMVSEKDAMELGRALHRACQRLDLIAGRDVLLVASSDMSHFLPDRETRAVDRVALEPLLAFDPGGLYRTVTEKRITMCGYIPATAMLTFARAAGSGDPRLVDYATSAEAFGDTSRVVGYAGVVLPGA